MSESNYEHEYKSTVIDFFDGRTSYDNESTVKRSLPLLEMVSLASGQQVLDVATGTGIIAIAAAQEVGPTGSVTGVDFSSGMLEQAQNKSNKLGLNNIEWVKADADYVEFEPDSFDAIFCSSALVYFKDISRTLKSWYRWLKPGGIAVFSGWSDQSYPAPWIIEACANNGIMLKNINSPTGSRERCVALMEDAGFENVAVEQRQLGAHRTVEQLSGWDGSWFHPEANPLSELSEEQLRQVISDYHRRIEADVTDAGIWCESLAYYMLGQES